MTIKVESEILPLKKVLLHKPGEEIENLTPEYLERLLFDDIPYLEIAAKEHDAFSDVLRENGVEVVYLHQLVAEVIKDLDIREKFINRFIEESTIQSEEMEKIVYEYLNSIKDEETLIRRTMAGVNKNMLPKLQNKGLCDYIEDEYPFVTDPMPNLYFTRDPFASIGNSISLNKMYSITRNRETIYADFIFKYHKDYKDTQRVYDRTYKHAIEGGDILNLSDRVLGIGISQRTTSQAIEDIAKKIFFEIEGNKIDTILAFNIPKSRSYMHLDTVFTQVDYDKFTIHPQIKGTLQVFEITKGENNTLNILKIESTLEDILSKHLNCDVKLIECGGGDYVVSQREQWNDGSNTLCIKPGEVVVYSRNYITNKILQDNGVKVHVIPSSELSRGRGGPRCMSMPLEREE